LDSQYNKNQEVKAQIQEIPDKELEQVKVSLQQTFPLTNNL
jgi:hypothetical protein